MSDEKPKRMSDEEWDRLDDLDIVDLTPTKWERARTEIERARASEKRLAERLDRARTMVGHILKRLDYQDIIKSGGDWACEKCHPSSDMLVPGFECALHQAEAFISESAALSEVES